MKEKRFEKVTKRKNSKYDLKNLIFNLVLTIIFSTLVLITNHIMFKVLLGFMIFVNLFYFLLMILDTKVYWREIKFVNVGEGVA